jgi:hypothetical protein
MLFDQPGVLRADHALGDLFGPAAGSRPRRAPLLRSSQALPAIDAWHQARTRIRRSSPVW